MDTRFGYRLFFGLLLLSWGLTPAAHADSPTRGVTGTVEYVLSPDRGYQWLGLVDHERKEYFYLETRDDAVRQQILQAQRDHRPVTLIGIRIYRGKVPYFMVESLAFAGRAPGEPALPPDPLAPHHFRPRTPPPVAATEQLAPGEPKLPASPAPPQARVPQRIRAPFTVDELRGDDGGQTVEVESLP